MKYVCSECKSTNIAILAWINPNDDKFIQDCDIYQGECYCYNCEKHTTIEEI